MTTSNHPYLESWSHFKEILAIGLVGWMPRKSGMLTRGLLYRGILGHMGNAVQIERSCEFFGSHRIQIGDRVLISHAVYMEAKQQGNQIVLGDRVRLADNIRLSSGGDQSAIYLRDGVILDRGIDIKAHEHGCIEIGKRTYIGPYSCLAGPGTIKIGQDCLIASHTGIYANNHNFADPARKISVQGTTNQGIVIEDDCWLGSGVKVLDGVTIGQGSVIGAGAVVTKDIPPFSVAVGVPAKVSAHRDGKQLAMKRLAEDFVERL